MVRNPLPQTFHTPAEIAARYGIAHEKILRFVKSGDLPAINVATDLAAAPRFLIDENGLAAFEAKRKIVPSVD